MKDKKIIESIKKEIKVFKKRRASEKQPSLNKKDCFGKICINNICKIIGENLIK